MSGLKNLVKILKKDREHKSFTDNFEHHYYKTLILQHPPRKPKEDMFSPSSLNKCDRELYYMIMGYEPEPQQIETHLNGSWKAILDAGTDRHERIQTTITRMKESGINLEWVDVEKYLKENKREGVSVIEKSGMETKLFSETLSARFLCDGIVSIDDEYHIVEIKTMGSNKFSKAIARDGINPEHVMQASAYSLALGINKILYIYENRDNNQIKVFLRIVTEQDKKDVINKIRRIQEYKKLGKVPPKPTDPSLCMYCNYKNRSSRDGYTPDLFKNVDFTDE